MLYSWFSGDDDDNNNRGVCYAYVKNARGGWGYKLPTDLSKRIWKGGDISFEPNTYYPLALIA